VKTELTFLYENKIKRKGPFRESSLSTASAITLVVFGVLTGGLSALRELERLSKQVRLSYALAFVTGLLVMAWAFYCAFWIFEHSR
jgi:hypothetical protein